MRKTLILVLSLALLVTALAGCASLPALTGTQAEQPAAPAAEAENGAQPAAGPAIQPAIAGASNAPIATGGTVRWEYYVLSVSAFNSPAGLTELNALGAQGWQLVAAPTSNVAIFKRPL